MRLASGGLLALMGVLLLGLNGVQAGEKSSFAEISHEDLAKAIQDKKVVLLDLNGTKKFKKAHIPGAIDCKSKTKKLKELLPKEKDALIVAYCSGPKCGAWRKGAKAAQALGYTNIKNYKPGISGWLAQTAKKRSGGKDKEGS